jgi:hypothetical protein
MENNKRHLALTHEEIELIIHALGIAESEYSEIYKKICATANARGNVRDTEQVKQAKNIYHKQACDFADLNCAIANSEKDI